jgi:predicted GNAT superfamily acetyltransferase
VAPTPVTWKSDDYVVALSEPAIRIGMCETIADLHACEDVQLAVWGGGEREIVPYDILRAILHAAGTVLGAWDGDRLVGIALSIVAWGAAGAYHHSHLLGVLPEYRRYHVGMRLKLAQREFVLAQGLDLITWTFDPLESANAHFNFVKLGVVSDTYLADFYGAMPEALNAGLPSDRLLVEWRLNAPHVLSRLAIGTTGIMLGPLVPPEVYDAPFLLHMAEDGAPYHTSPPDPGGGWGVDRLRIEIPASIQVIKATDLARALAWRMATRAAFTDVLAAGYLVTDYRAPRFHRPECGCYLLART